MTWLENLNILSVWWFIFFLLIFLVGYIFVEILLWKVYWFRSNFEKYENNLFDRIIHYIAWWIILNILYIYFCVFTWTLKNLADLFNISWSLWWTLWFLWDSINLQFIFFSIQYFLLLIIILITFVLIWRLIINGLNFIFILFIKDKSDKKK